MSPILSIVIISKVVISKGIVSFVVISLQKCFITSAQIILISIIKQFMNRSGEKASKVQSYKHFVVVTYNRNLLEPARYSLWLMQLACNVQL
jgi:hypothetical protein